MYITQLAECQMSSVAGWAKGCFGEDHRTMVGQCVLSDEEVEI